MLFEKSSTIQIEGLVPGINFSNYDPKGKELLEFDDENESIIRVHLQYIS